MAFSLHQALLTGPPALQAVAHEKKNRLEAYLQRHYHCALRDDSRLAWAYVMKPDQCPDPELEHVAREIWYVKLLHDYTHYPQLCQDLLPLVKTSLQSRRTSPAWVSQHIQKYVLPALQLECMVKLMTDAGWLGEKGWKVQQPPPEGSP